MRPMRPFVEDVMAGNAEQVKNGDIRFDALGESIRKGFFWD
jgi:hypothetical protein